MDAFFKSGYTAGQVLGHVEKRCTFCNPDIVDVVSLCMEDSFTSSAERERILGGRHLKSVCQSRIENVGTRSEGNQAIWELRTSLIEDMTRCVTASQRKEIIALMRRRFADRGLSTVELGRQVRRVCSGHRRLGRTFECGKLLDSPQTMIDIANHWYTSVLRPWLQEGFWVAIALGSRRAIPLGEALTMKWMMLLRCVVHHAFLSLVQDLPAAFQRALMRC
jgi:hypothetical protein